MTPASIVELGDVQGKPRMKMDLPSPMRIGDRVKLHARLSRQNGGRSEVLDISGDFQVRSVSFDASDGLPRQLLVVESSAVAPVWKAIKRGPPSTRKLGPARSPSTAIE